MAKHSNRRFFIPPDDPLIAEGNHLFINKELNSIEIDVPPSAVAAGDVSRPQEFILALQHYPDAIERLLFSLQFNFEQIEDSELYYPPEVWRADAKYSRWFRKMGELPITLFFLNDSEARFRCLAGDFLAGNKLPIVKWNDAKTKAKVQLSPAIVKEMTNRLFQSCLLLLIYCHGSGFNPKEYIQSILADYSLPLKYDAIYKEYTKSIKSGASFFVKGQ